MCCVVCVVCVCVCLTCKLLWHRRYQTHEIVLQAIREQEEQMQVLSDIIPGAT